MQNQSQSNQPRSQFNQQQNQWGDSFIKPAQVQQNQGKKHNGTNGQHSGSQQQNKKLFEYEYNTNDVINYKGSNIKEGRQQQGRIPHAADIFDDEDEEDEEIIDEIIETDPDESLHHPIVDGMEDEEEENNSKDGDGIKQDKFSGDDQGNFRNANVSEAMNFDAYDSRFFQRIKDESDPQSQNEIQFQKGRPTSAIRRPGTQKPPLMTNGEGGSVGGANKYQADSIEGSQNTETLALQGTPSGNRQQFGQFSLIQQSSKRPTSSAKQRPSDTQIKRRSSGNNRVITANQYQNAKSQSQDSQSNQNQIEINQMNQNQQHGFGSSPQSASQFQLDIEAKDRINTMQSYNLNQNIQKHQIFPSSSVPLARNPSATMRSVGMQQNPMMMDQNHFYQTMQQFGPNQAKMPPTNGVNFQIAPFQTWQRTGPPVSALPGQIGSRQSMNIMPPAPLTHLPQESSQSDPNIIVSSLQKTSSDSSPYPMQPDNNRMAYQQPMPVPNYGQLNLQNQSHPHYINFRDYLDPSVAQPTGRLQVAYQAQPGYLAGNLAPTASEMGFYGTICSNGSAGSLPMNSNYRTHQRGSFQNNQPAFSVVDTNFDDFETYGLIKNHIPGLISFPLAGSIQKSDVYLDEPYENVESETEDAISTCFKIEQETVINNTNNESGASAIRVGQDLKMPDRQINCHQRLSRTEERNIQLKLVQDQNEKREGLYRQACQIKKWRREKRMRDKKQSQMEQEHDEHIIYRSNQNIMTYNSIVVPPQNMEQLNYGSPYYQNQTIQKDPAEQQQQNHLPINLQALNPREQSNTMQQDIKELRQKQKQQMQLQEQQFRLSMSSMKNQISEVIKEDLNESVRSNTGRNSLNESKRQPKEDPENEIKEIVTGTGEEPVKPSTKNEMQIQQAQELNPTHQNSEEKEWQPDRSTETKPQPLEVIEIENEDHLQEIPESQLINKIFNQVDKADNERKQEERSEVKGKIRDLIELNKQQNQQLIQRIVSYDQNLQSSSIHPRTNPKHISYEVFFQNPSGISEDFVARDEEEDDLLQNQNKSATAIDEENDQLHMIEEIDAQNQNEPEQPAARDRNKQVQPDATEQQQAELPQDLSNDPLKYGDDGNEPRQTPASNKKMQFQQQIQKQDNESQIESITKQIEGISTLLLSLNDYLAKNEEVTPKNTIHKFRESDKLRNKQSLMESMIQKIPELPAEEADQKPSDNAKINDDTEKVETKLDEKGGGDAQRKLALRHTNTMNTMNSSSQVRKVNDSDQSKLGGIANGYTTQQSSNGGIIDIQLDNQKKQQRHPNNAQRKIKIKRMTHKKAVGNVVQQNRGGETAASKRRQYLQKSHSQQLKKQNEQIANTKKSKRNQIRIDPSSIQRQKNKSQSPSLRMRKNGISPQHQQPDPYPQLHIPQASNPINRNQLKSAHSREQQAYQIQRTWQPSHPAASPQNLPPSQMANPFLMN